MKKMLLIIILSFVSIFFSENTFANPNTDEDYWDITDDGDD